MPLVAVAPHRHAFGVAEAADDWRFPQGSDRNGRPIERAGRVVQEGIASPYEVQDLTNALAAEHKTDAHLVPYILRDPRGFSHPRQPRLNKSGLSFVRSLGWHVTVEVLLADIDNPGHVAWTDELREEARRLDRQLATAGVYYSAHGRRIVQPLTVAVRVDESARVEHVHAAWLRYLQGLGFHVDDGCQDWTRHYRLPHVRRNGRFSRSELVDLSRMAPIDPPEPAPLLGRRRKAPHSMVDLGRAGEVDGSELAKAFEAAGWAGPSLGRGKRSVRCPFAASHTGGRDFDSSTILFGPTPRWPLGYVHCSHAHCAGRLQTDFIAALPEDARRLVPREPPKPKRERARELVAKPEARAALEQAFRKAPDGLSVVIAGCGTGKTEAAITVAAERAARPHASAKAEGARAPLHSQTAISVPTTKLAIEVAERARERGVSVRRVFGPLSVRRPDGSRECRIYECARAFSAGGLSVPWELCEGRGKSPCEYAETCGARGGTEGPEDARVLIGPHALLSRLEGGIGKTGLLVIDEPPPLLDHEVLESDDLRRAADELEKFFEARYAIVLRPALISLAAWVQTGPLDKPGPLALGLAAADPELVDAALRQTGAESLLEALAAAHEPVLEEKGRRPSSAPPVQRQAAYAARHSQGIARQIGHGSKVARIVWTALTSRAGTAIARLEERGERRVLVVTLPNTRLHGALTREGAVVVADAGGHHHLEVYRQIVGYSPQTTEVYAEEGAPVARTLLERRASRAGWMHHGQLVVDAGLVRSVELAVSWLNEGTGRAALVTFQALEQALRAARGEHVREEWVRAGQKPEALEAARRALAPALARLDVELDLGHYGGVRGLDHWKDHSALVTLGDPWSQLGDARWEGEYLRLSDWESRYAEAARHELEQAHGRLRTVHRTTPARALHVGVVVPGGWDPATVERRTDAGGRPRFARRDDVRELVAREGVSGAARTLGVDRNTVRRYLTTA
jgi:hypothetical protein